MTTQISREQFLQALRDHPEWREEIRKEILGEELLRLPVEFRAFVKEQKEFNARQEEFNARQEEFNARQEEFNARQKEFNAEALRRFDNIERRLDRMESDNSTIKSQNLENRTSRLAILLCARMDQDFVRTLDARELSDMSRNEAPSLMSRGERESFINADLVVEAESNGATAYIAAEISFTGAMRDYQRARRNSGYLNRLTGWPAAAAIVSVRNDNEVQDLIDAGEIHWCHPEV